MATTQSPSAEYRAAQLRVNVSLSLTLDEIAALAPSDRDDYVEALRTYALPILAELRDEAWREYEQLEDEP